MARQDGTSATDTAKQLAGAGAFIGTMEVLLHLRDELIGETGSYSEVDWPQIVDRLRANLDANLLHPDPLHRQGHLRALADLVLTNVDGGAVGIDWDGRAALRHTAAGFDGPALSAPDSQ